jgi:hypothetical protein
MPSSVVIPALSLVPLSCPNDPFTPFQSFVSCASFPLACATSRSGLSAYSFRASGSLVDGERKTGSTPVPVLGKAMTSRMDLASQRIATRRSKPERGHQRHAHCALEGHSAGEERKSSG